MLFFRVNKIAIVNQCFLRMPVIAVKKVSGEIVENADRILCGIKLFG